MPTKSAARRKRLAALAPIPATLVFFESPNRIGALLEDAAEIFGASRAAALCREITKIHETFDRDTLSALAARYRGFHRYDLTTCIGCDKCAVACPVDCIYIDKEKAPVGKGFRINGFTIDYTKCMFCAFCVEPCPVDCIFMGSNHDLSCYSRDGCIVDYAKLPLQVAWGQATLNPTAVAESKVLYEPVWVKGEPSPFEIPSS